MALAVLVFTKHVPNIARLMKGREGRIGLPRHEFGVSDS
jgi:glycerol-3-phosphate acyltransferase PlsY